MSFNPFRTAAPRPPEPEPNHAPHISRSASWTLDKVKLEWVGGSAHVELSVGDETKRMHVKDVLGLMKALECAFHEANKLGSDSEITATQRQGEEKP